jgi:hypothetical protein
MFTDSFNANGRRPLTILYLIEVGPDIRFLTRLHWSVNVIGVLAININVDDRNAQQGSGILT